MIGILINKLFGIKKKEASKKDYDWDNFRKSFREQFRKLKEKGINMPIYFL
jgi:hypothetical protein